VIIVLSPALGGYVPMTLLLFPTPFALSAKCSCCASLATLQKLRGTLQESFFLQHPVKSYRGPQQSFFVGISQRGIALRAMSGLPTRGRIFSEKADRRFAQDDRDGRIERVALIKRWLNLKCITSPS